MMEILTKAMDGAQNFCIIQDPFASELLPSLMVWQVGQEGHTNWMRYRSSCGRVLTGTPTPLKAAISVSVTQALDKAHSLSITKAVAQ